MGLEDVLFPRTLRGDRREQHAMKIRAHLGSGKAPCRNVGLGLLVLLILMMVISR